MDSEGLSFGKKYKFDKKIADTSFKYITTTPYPKKGTTICI